MCVYVCLHMCFVQALRVFNSSVCGCVLFTLMQSGEVSASTAAGYQ